MREGDDRTEGEKRRVRRGGIEEKDVWERKEEKGGRKSRQGEKSKRREKREG